MMIPAFPVLPSPTMLSPLQTMSKLSGLGDDTVISDTGGTIDLTPSVPDTFSAGDLASLFGPSAGPNAGGISSGAEPLTQYQDAQGNIVFPGQGQISPAGVVSYFNAPSNPNPSAPATPQGMTSAQQAALANTLLQGGLTLAKEVAAQPGMTISPNGAINFQNKGFPTPGVSASVTTPSSSSMTMIAIAAIAAVAVFSMGRK